MSSALKEPEDYFFLLFNRKLRKSIPHTMTVTVKTANNEQESA